jgi:hypothetical protein
MHANVSCPEEALKETTSQALYIKRTLLALLALTKITAVTWFLCQHK